jgi:hypothetical protein
MTVAKWILAGGLLCLPCGALLAQDSFAYRVVLDTVRKPGFYKIMLSPQVVAKCRPDLGDLRIQDQEGHMAPYVLKEDMPVITREAFREFPILSNERKDSVTEIVIENKEPGVLRSLLLVMKNTSVRRMATLSGSDDRRTWYAIRENILLEDAGSDEADHSIQSISFPTSRYHYFKISLDDKGLLPIHILQAGIATRNSTSGDYTDIPDAAISQKDSNKRSYIALGYKESYRIDKLELEIEGPPLYKRTARLFNADSGANDEGIITSFSIDPVSHSFRIPTIKSKRLLLEIANADDAPLRIKKVTGSQLNHYLLAYLQNGFKYQLLAGDPHSAAPDYDLRYFADSLAKAPEEISAGPLEAFDRNEMKPAASHKGWLSSGLMLWCILGLLLVLLVYLSLRMLKGIEHDRV